MNSPAVFLIAILFLLGISLCGLVLSFGVARRNWKQWQRTRRLHIISATAPQMRQRDRKWPANEVYWPDPFAEELTPIMGELWSAYSRVAASRERDWRYWADGVIVVSGAALGIQLPLIVQNSTAYVAAVSSVLDQFTYNTLSGRFDIASQDLAPIFLQFVLLASFIGVGGSFFLRLKADFFKELDILYTHAARLCREKPGSSLPRPRARLTGYLGKYLRSSEENR